MNYWDKWLNLFISKSLIYWTYWNILSQGVSKGLNHFSAFTHFYQIKDQSLDQGTLKCGWGKVNLTHNLLILWCRGLDVTLIRERENVSEIYLFMSSEICVPFLFIWQHYFFNCTAQLKHFGSPPTNFSLVCWSSGSSLLTELVWLRQVCLPPHSHMSTKHGAFQYLEIFSKEWTRLMQLHNSLPTSCLISFDFAKTVNKWKLLIVKTSRN